MITKYDAVTMPSIRIGSETEYSSEIELDIKGMLQLYADDSVTIELDDVEKVTLQKLMTKKTGKCRYALSAYINNRKAFNFIIRYDVIYVTHAKGWIDISYSDYLEIDFDNVRGLGFESVGDHVPDLNDCETKHDKLMADRY